MVEIVEVAVCTIRVAKMKEHLLFIDNSAYFVLEIELLLTVLCNFEREASNKDSAF